MIIFRDSNVSSSLESSYYSKRESIASSNLIITITEERRKTLINEVYSDPPSSGAPPPAEVLELMKVFDWQEDSSVIEKPVLDFDELDLPYKNFNHYLKAKHNCLTAYLSYQRTQHRLIEEHKSIRNDIISCIHNSVAQRLPHLSS